MQKLQEEPEFSKFSRIPVFDTDRDYITGYVRKADALDTICSGSKDTQVKAAMRRILYFSEDDKVAEMWKTMLEKKEHIAVVTDEYGCMRGIVTMEDIIETMLGVEIVDECDTDTDLQAVARQRHSQRIYDLAKECV